METRYLQRGILAHYHLSKKGCTEQEEIQVCMQTREKTWGCRYICIYILGRYIIVSINAQQWNYLIYCTCENG